jgi:hypothetical protein
VAHNERRVPDSKIRRGVLRDKLWSKTDASEWSRRFERQVVISWPVMLTGAQAVEAQAFVRHRRGDSSVFLQQSRPGVEESDRIDKMFMT